MSLDRLQSKTGSFVISPENTSGGFPGNVALGPNAGICEGAAANTGGASYNSHTPKNGTAPTIANGGTFTHNGHGVCVVTTGGAVTGAIVQAGTYPGQRLALLNQSANTVTMAAAGTSNVAAGTSAVVPATGALDLIWCTLDSRWYDVG